MLKNINSQTPLVADDKGKYTTVIPHQLEKQDVTPSTSSLIIKEKDNVRSLATNPVQYTPVSTLDKESIMNDIRQLQDDYKINQEKLNQQRKSYKAALHVQIQHSNAKSNEQNYIALKKDIDNCNTIKEQLEQVGNMIHNTNIHEVSNAEITKVQEELHAQKQNYIKTQDERNSISQKFDDATESLSDIQKRYLVLIEENATVVNQYKDLKSSASKICNALLTSITKKNEENDNMILLDKSLESSYKILNKEIVNKSKDYIIGLLQKTELPIDIKESLIFGQEKLEELDILRVKNTYYLEKVKGIQNKITQNIILQELKIELQNFQTQFEEITQNITSKVLHCITEIEQNITIAAEINSIDQLKELCAVKLQYIVGLLTEELASIEEEYRATYTYLNTKLKSKGLEDIHTYIAYTNEASKNTVRSLEKSIEDIKKKKKNTQKNIKLLEQNIKEYNKKHNIVSKQLEASETIMYNIQSQLKDNAVELRHTKKLYYNIKKALQYINEKKEKDFQCYKVANDNFHKIQARHENYLQTLNTLHQEFIDIIKEINTIAPGSIATTSNSTSVTPSNLKDAVANALSVLNSVSKKKSSQLNQIDKNVIEKLNKLSQQLPDAIKTIEEFETLNSKSNDNYILAKDNIEKKYNIEISNFTQSNKTSYVDRLFFAITLLIILVDALSSAFSLIAKYYDLSTYKKYATYICYSISIILSLFLILQSCIALKQINKDKQVNATTNNLVAIQRCQNILSVIGSIMWITLFSTSLYMLYYGDISRLITLNLVLSLLAPLIGFISCTLRVSDQLLQQKQNKQQNKQQNKLLNIILSPTMLCAIVCMLEFIHFICHILEAVDLRGKTQNIYDFSIVPAIILQLIISVVFMLVEISNEIKIHNTQNNAALFYKISNPVDVNTSSNLSSNDLSSLQDATILVHVQQPSKSH
ncbi:hypothetical protein HL033_00895 [Neoehrlichia mikurensis]|uniref:Uncharacterized protein n=1 Tax=Neoehrlichia mikurensis TaxID=89586 RepID=A0A9Q9BZ00_9RICK|nr:hypothetical protein [Neoehrlichia mikurensis]QXK92583.1 hypothetical protein HUN61_00895 [Neoehrlichia mikurensis]QXK93820.1 hypothetical protein HL033_00895 [Neoehrlichia mikurensis]UTO55185.1 hypothetical protein LUA82_03235 [Neoehrlichia mikurensis]UTO56105.1 hypothetical protein LUA81_03210 [Neoehrlichia mikurensis]